MFILVSGCKPAALSVQISPMAGSALIKQEAVETPESSGQICPVPAKDVHSKGIHGLSSRSQARVRDYKYMMENYQPSTSKSAVSATVCSPTLLVKNISAEIEAMEGPSNFHSPGMKMLPYCRTPLRSNSHQSSSTTNDSCDNTVVIDFDNNFETSELFNEVEDGSVQKPVEDLDTAGQNGAMETVPDAADIGDQVIMTQDTEQVLEGFCVIENVETLSKESFMLLDENLKSEEL